MYAIIKTGGKQYRVTEGQILRIEKLVDDVGQSVKFNNVLMVSANDGLHFGSPYIQNTNVTAQIVNHGRGSKVDIIKFKRRKHHLKRLGHRQDFTEIKIINIVLNKKK
ncbi:MAG: 50S ribosomal protein L21 [Coxiella-like endosymbiont]|uniref:50S ribosomal protein L21 n=1 Tax=Coxiella-like endosymbiont TaxID=1592897 RepID=UPI00215A4D28|nr:50S ribosomal protein L21 [Coxiella-like endosymbiont]UVE59602.1 50S ribosomal protein L21 [Coxiella-like endosymbiont]